jgi:hypothetical protein
VSVSANWRSTPNAESGVHYPYDCAPVNRE